MLAIVYIVTVTMISVMTLVGLAVLFFGVGKSLTKQEKEEVEERTREMIRKQIRGEI